jgi:hypothetical protein
MKNFVLSICFCFIWSVSIGQTIGNLANQLTDSQGFLIKPANRDNVQGSPYLSEDWSAGTLNISAEKKFKLSRLRFDALLNRVEYQYEEKVYEPTVAFNEFTIQLSDGSGSKTFRRGFPATDETTEKTFYEVLYDGKAKLLRKTHVRINDYAEPLSTVRVKRFAKVQVLYLYDTQTSQLTKLEKKDKKNILAVLSSKKEQLSQFLEEQKLKPNSEGNIIKLLAYYDTL